ncbi:MAG: carboxypeptidase regulatory-like domain-containing protein [Bryobacteraceae bacterium]|nr:carboxypeptidase regulatory-like domain-containing protein [Bryobacteraceae bacterium]
MSIFLRVFAVSLCAALAVFGQSETGKSALEGRVLDPAGSVISNVAVTIRHTRTGQKRQAISNRDGQFRAGALTVGTYVLETNHAGFAASRTNEIELLVGETKSVTLTLSVAAQATQVTVDAAAEIVNKSDINNSTTVSERQISDLPIRGRNFVEFIQLTPNVMQEGNRYGIVVNGQRSINSNISVDGMDFNDSLQGGQRGGGPNESAYFFPQLAVREFQVVRDGASAEVGRTNSGYVNVVTKSGTNDYHGAAFYANRNGSLTSPDAFGNDSSSNSQNQLGGSVGGRLRRDKLFFFAAVEKNLVTIPYTVKFNTPTGNVTIPADILNQQGSFNQKNNPLVAFGRLDYQLNTNHTVNLQYTFAAQHGLNFGGQSGQTNQASSNNTILDRESQGVKMAVTTVLSASLLNEVRGQWAFDNRTQKPNSNFAQVDIADFGTLGGSSNGTYIYNATRYQVLDNLTWNRGRHTLKMGIDMNFNPQQQQRETNYGGRYTFSTLADYLLAVKRQ